MRVYCTKAEKPTGAKDIREMKRDTDDRTQPTNQPTTGSREDLEQTAAVARCPRLFIRFGPQVVGGLILI